MYSLHFSNKSMYKHIIPLHSAIKITNYDTDVSEEDSFFSPYRCTFGKENYENAFSEVRKSKKVSKIRLNHNSHLLISFAGEH